MLTATRLTGAVLDHVVVGFGLNVSLRVADLPALNRGLPPTSLAIELGAAPERLAVLQAVLESIDTAYTILRRGGGGESARCMARAPGWPGGVGPRRSGVWPRRPTLGADTDGALPWRHRPAK